MAPSASTRRCRVACSRHPYRRAPNVPAHAPLDLGPRDVDPVASLDRACARVKGVHTLSMNERVHRFTDAVPTKSNGAGCEAVELVDDAVKGDVADEVEEIVRRARPSRLVLKDKRLRSTREGSKQGDGACEDRLVVPQWLCGILPRKAVVDLADPLAVGNRKALVLRRAYPRPARIEPSWWVGRGGRSRTSGEKSAVNSRKSVSVLPKSKLGQLSSTFRIACVAHAFWMTCMWRHRGHRCRTGGQRVETAGVSSSRVWRRKRPSPSNSAPAWRRRARAARPWQPGVWAQRRST